MIVDLAFLPSNVASNPVFPAEESSFACTPLKSVSLPSDVVTTTSKRPEGKHLTFTVFSVFGESESGEYESSDWKVIVRS